MQKSNLVQRKKVDIKEKSMRVSLSLKSVFGRKKPKKAPRQKSNSYTVGDNVSKFQFGKEQKEPGLCLSPTNEEEEFGDGFKGTWSPNPLTLQSSQQSEDGGQVYNKQKENHNHQNIQSAFNKQVMQPPPPSEMKKQKPTIEIEASYSEDAMQQYFAEYGTMPESMKTLETEQPELFPQYTVDKVQTYFTQHGTLPSQEFWM